MKEIVCVGRPESLRRRMSPLAQGNTSSLMVKGGATGSLSPSKWTEEICVLMPGGDFEKFLHFSLSENLYL